MGAYIFCPADGSNVFIWRHIWTFNQLGVDGCYGFPIIPEEPWVMWAMSLPPIVGVQVGANANTLASFTAEVGFYANQELHNTNGWLPVFGPNVPWNAVRDVSGKLSGPDINYIMDNPFHWRQIADFIKRSAGYTRKLLSLAPVQLLEQIHPLAPAIANRVNDIAGVVEKVL